MVGKHWNKGVKAKPTEVNPLHKQELVEFSKAMDYNFDKMWNWIGTISELIDKVNLKIDTVAKRVGCEWTEKAKTKKWDDVIKLKEDIKDVMIDSKLKKRKNKGVINK